MFCSVFILYKHINIEVFYLLYPVTILNNYHMTQGDQYSEPGMLQLWLSLNEHNTDIYFDILYLDD